MKIGQKVKVKSLEQLRKISGISFRQQVTLKCGLIFKTEMLNFAGQTGIITEIANPGKHNKLTADSYKIGEIKIYWSTELLEEIK